MRLSQLAITNFGALHERTIEFGHGVTVLVGANEAGKSTVLHCIAHVLLGKPAQRSLFPTFAPWQGGEFSASLRLAGTDGNSFRLLRHFAENGQRAAALYHVCHDGSERLVTRENSEIRKWVAQAFGTADERIFYRIFSLTQADLHPLDHYAGLREQLEHAISGAEIAVTSAVQRVDDRLAELRRGVNQPALPQNWGALKRAIEERKAWESRRHQARRQQQQLMDLRRRMAILQEKIATSSARIEEITDLLEAERQRHEGMLRLQELRAAWALLDGAREQTAQLSVDVNRLENELAAFPKAFADPVSLRMRVTRWHQRGSSLLMKSWPLALVFLLIGVTMVALSFPLSGGVLAALGILLGGISGIQARRLAHDRFDICTECEVARIVDIERQLADYERCRSELTVTQRALSAVSSANHDEQRHALMVEIAKQEEILQRFVGPALTAEKVYQLERELVVLKNSLQETQQEEHRYLREVAVLEDVEQQMIDIDDGAEYWTNEVARAREEEQTLLLARDLLLQAGEHAHAAIANPLAARISPIFAEMTGGALSKDPGDR